MQLSNKILSDITVHMKYARFLESKKRILYCPNTQATLYTQM